MWYAGLTLFLLAAAHQHKAAVGTAKQSPKTYWPFVLSLVLAAVSSKEPHHTAEGCRRILTIISPLEVCCLLISPALTQAHNWAILGKGYG